jgi:hypothetical protein
MSTLLASTAGDAAYWALAVFLVAVGLASALMLFCIAPSTAARYVTTITRQNQEKYRRRWDKS